MEKKSKLATLLMKVEASVSTESGEDTFVSLNDSLAKNLRSVYGAGNGDCSGNGSCDNNGTCKNNNSCNGNGTCVNPATGIEDTIGSSSTGSSASNL